MPLQEIIKNLEQKTPQLEINTLLAKEADAKLDASTQKDFYQCFNLLVEQGYQDEAIILAKKYNYVGLDEHDVSSPLVEIVLKRRYKLAEALIQSHLDQGGKLAAYHAKKIPLLSLIFRTERTNEMDEDGCYNFAKFLINHDAADSFIEWTTNKPASPYIARDGASTIRMIQLLEEKGFTPTLNEMIPNYFGDDDTEEVNKNVDEDALVYLFKKYFIPGSSYNRWECPQAISFLKNAVSEGQISLTEFLLKKGVNPNSMQKFSLGILTPPAIILLLKKYNYSGVTGEAGKIALLESWTTIQMVLSISDSYRNSQILLLLRLINTLLQCEINVAPTELKNLALLNVTFLLQHGFHHLAYLAKPPLTPAEQKEFQILMNDAKPPVYFQGTETLKAAAREKTPDEIKSQARGEEYIHTRLEVVETAGPFNPRLENGKELYKKISDRDFWMLCVDGEQIMDGPTTYDGREYGSIRAMQNAYQHMLTEFIDKPLSKEILKTMHKDITARVGNLGLEPSDTGGEFRKNDSDVHFNLTNTTMTPKGLEEIKLMEAENGSFVLQKKRAGIYQIQVKNLEDKEKGKISALNRLVDHILEKYHKKIEEINVKASEDKQDAKLLDEERLKTITACIMELERTHPFDDANCRTFTLALNLMLLKNGFCPTLLTDPNRMDGFDVESFVREIKQGMINFQHLAEHSRAPGEGTTKEIVMKAMHNRVYPYIDFKCDTGKMKELGIPVSRIKGAVVTMPILHWAVQFNYADMVDIARDCKQDMNIRDTFNNTALMIAAFNGNNEMMSMLLKFPETDVHLEGQFGLTAYDLARLQGHTQIAQTLVERGAKPKDDVFYADKNNLLAKFGYDALFVKKAAPIASQEMKASAVSMFNTLSAGHNKTHATDETKKTFPKQLELPASAASPVPETPNPKNTNRA